MRSNALSTLASYNPTRLIEGLADTMRVENDFQLSRMLSLPPSCISKIRNRRVIVTAQTLIAMHEASGLSIRELRDLMGDTRAFFF